AAITAVTPSPSGAAGTYTGTSTTPATSVLLSVDTNSHGTLWVLTGGISGGGLVTVGADGTLQTTDGMTTAQWNPAITSGTNFTLTKLNGVAVNVPLTLVRTTRAKWTFLVYLDAANNLRDFGPLNFNQMEQVGSTADVNIVVQWKQA